MSDPSFGSFGDKIKYRNAGGFAAGTCSGGDGYKGMKRFGDRKTPAKGDVNKIKEVGIGETRVEVHELGGVDDLRYMEDSANSC